MNASTQSVQNAINALQLSHTEIHKALAALKQGAVVEGNNQAVLAAHKVINAIAAL